MKDLNDIIKENIKKHDIAINLFNSMKLYNSYSNLKYFDPKIILNNINNYHMSYMNYFYFLKIRELNPIIEKSFKKLPSLVQEYNTYIESLLYKYDIKESDYIYFTRILKKFSIRYFINDYRYSDLTVKLFNLLFDMEDHNFILLRNELNTYLEWTNRKGEKNKSYDLIRQIKEEMETDLFINENSLNELLKLENQSYY